jgi:hypothetical protein
MGVISVDEENFGNVSAARAALETPQGVGEGEQQAEAAGSGAVFGEIDSERYRGGKLSLCG